MNHRTARHPREVDRDALLDERRLEQGYVVILPGIEGHSRWNRGIRKGLVDAGVPYAIEIHDWTRGPLWYLWNLRDSRRHRDQAQVIAEKIVDYRQRYPDRPVYLIGHSGGGAMTAFSLSMLPDDVKATAGVMIVGALSPGFDLTPALRHTERGLWNYSSPGDILFLGLGTLAFGSCDGRHALSAGLTGFRRSSTDDSDATPCLHQMWYRWKMLRQFNLGGHLSCVNPRFIREWIAPIVLGGDDGDSRPSAAPPAESRTRAATTANR